MNLNMNCGNCKFYHKLKFEDEKEFKESSCCIALTRLDGEMDSYEAFVIETTEEDMCEMFTDKDELTKC